MANLPKLYGKNAKKHPDKQLKLIAGSLREFGWQQPIVVDKNDEIIVGHGRWMAYQKYPEGIKDPWIITAEDLTKDQVKAYRLADNKLNESDWEMESVIEELRELPEDLFDLTGFDKELLMVNDKLSAADEIDISVERKGVIQVLPPESPKLKEKAIIYCDNIKDYEKIKKAILNDEIDGNKLKELL